MKTVRSALLLTALVGLCQPMVAQTKKAPQQSSHQPPPKSAATPTAKETEAPNAGLCRDLAQRATGWDRVVIEFAKGKAKAEAELANCRMQEKDRKTLPHQCDQYAMQIDSFREELTKAEEGKAQTRAAWEKYRCK